MFLDYDKVPHSAYDLYQQYAEQTPSSDTRHLARIILGHSGMDTVVSKFREDLHAMKYQQDLVPVEYALFAIRNAADATTFDVYLLDEDSLFIAVEVGVAQDDVMETGLHMMQQEYYTSGGSQFRFAPQD
jgi:hypothetical protein